MPQYTSTRTTSRGTVINAVLNTETNTTTYTITTAPSGFTATVTSPAGTNGTGDEASSTANLNSIRNQITAANGGDRLAASLELAGFGEALRSTSGEVQKQASTANAVSTATGQPVPDAPSPPTPVAAADNPNPTPNLDVVVTPVRDAPPATTEDTPNTTTTTPIIENTAPPATTNPDVNNGAIGLGVDTAVIQQSAAEDTASKQADALAAADGLITPSVQQSIASDAETAQVNALAEADGLITPSVQKTIEGDAAEAAQVNALAEADGLITPSVQKTIASDAETAQVNASAAADGLITPSVQQQINAIGVKKAETRSTATTQDSSSFQKAKDWRVRISLAPNSKYLYNADSPGILAPLSGRSGTGTNGVIFPYTPNISVAYAANYDPTDIAHSNYKIFQYKSSSVDSISITGDFTAQDTNEANYMLAVIHFFRSVTKMFYGQDKNPKPGVPPPLCYLSGFGTYQFDNHPMVITNFTYTTPTDVDYIRAGSQTNMPGQSVAQQPSTVNTSSGTASAIRLSTSNLTPRLPNFQKQNSSINSDATYVPTKISIAITALPVVARNDISNRFSLEKYATGQLLQGSKNNGGGIW